MKRDEPNPLNYPYLHDVDRCPACGSGSIELDDPCEREPDMTESDCRCRDCGFEWQDVFEKRPYFIGRQIDGELLQAPQQIVEQAARDNAWELAAVLPEAAGELLRYAPPNNVTAALTLKRLNRLIDLITKGVPKHGS